MLRKCAAHKMPTGLALAAVLLFAGAIALTGPQNVEALPVHMEITLYYMDASYTKIVGESWLLCNGIRTSEGAVTAFERTRRRSCDDLPMPFNHTVFGYDSVWSGDDMVSWPEQIQ